MNWEQQGIKPLAEAYDNWVRYGGEMNSRGEDAEVRLNGAVADAVSDPMLKAAPKMLATLRDLLSHLDAGGEQSRAFAPEIAMMRETIADAGIRAVTSS